MVCALGAVAVNRVAAGPVKRGDGVAACVAAVRCADDGAGFVSASGQFSAPLIRAVCAYSAATRGCLEAAEFGRVRR